MLKLTYTENSFYLEVTLEGSWLSEGNDDAVGVFVTTMSYGAEFFCINFGKSLKFVLLSSVSSRRQHLGFAQ
jgi:hypothetical protein